MADFETVSTSSLQIRVKIPRSPSPSPTVRSERNSVLRSSSMRASRLDQPPRGCTHTTAASNTLSVRPSAYKTSRSLSPRPPRLETTSPETRPPPHSPSSGFCLPTRAPTPPSKFCESKGLRVPGVSRGNLTPRSLSPRLARFYDWGFFFFA